MTAPAERTKSMRAYAEAFGDPDVETSARMEQRLEAMIAAEESGPSHRRRWLPWIIVVVLVGIGGVATGIWLGGSSKDGVFSATSKPQRLRLSGGAAVLQPGAELRVLHDDGRAVIELRAGTIALEPVQGGGVQVLSGAYTVEADAAQVEVQHSPGVPVVTVTSGEAIVRGPDLPPAGVVIIPVAREDP